MEIYRVIKIYQDPDKMEEINKITEIGAFETDNWIDYYTFKKCVELNDYVEKEDIEALKNNKADFIVFRIDR